MKCFSILKPAYFSMWNTLGFRLIVLLVSPLDKPVLLHSSSSPVTLLRQLCKLSFRMCVSTPQADALPNATNLLSLGFLRFFFLEDDAINLLLESNSIKDLLKTLGPEQIDTTCRGTPLQAGTRVSQHGPCGEPAIFLHRAISGNKSCWGAWLLETSVMNTTWVSLSLQKQQYRLFAVIPWRMVLGNYFKK